MPLKLNSSGGGSVTLDVPSTASTFTLTAPAETGTVITSGTATGINATAMSAGTVPKARLPSGSILQVVQTVLTGTFSTTSTTFTDITGVSAAITPTSATSKIFVMVSMYRGCTAAVQTRFRLMRAGSAIYIADAAGSRSQSSAGGYVGNADVGYHFSAVDIKYIDSPATTSSITYNMQLACQGGETIYIGRTGTDADAATTMRAPASITLMEIAQ